MEARAEEAPEPFPPPRVEGPGVDERSAPRAATVTGVVLGPGGRPAAGAHVRGAGRIEARTGQGGAFRLTGIAPGVVALVAWGQDLAPGPALVLDLLPGETRGDVVLRLRRGSRILGEVLDATGAPERGVRVSASDPPSSVETDDEGRFALAGLSPGRQEVRTTTHAGLVLARHVEIDEGATERVRLQLPADPAVHLHGTVTADGLEVTTGRVRAERTDDDGLAVACATDVVEGNYALQLPGPGEYELSVELRPAGGAGVGWRDRLDVPAVDDHEHDLVVPLGRILGRVVDDQGVPLPGVPVETTPERHGREHGNTRTRTTAGGRFTLTVPPGLHTVTAGARLGLSPGEPDDGQHTQVRAEGVRVAAGAAIELADLVVARAGRLEGTLTRSDGTPAEQATLWSYGTGRTERLGPVEHGAFRLEGLAPGTLHIGAAGAGEASAVPVSCEITAGATTRVELQLAPATSVHVRALDAIGVAIGCDLDAIDARGVPVALVRGTTGEVWLGPLPPGAYVVRALRDGQRWERAFTVRGGGPGLEIDLVLE